MSGTNAIVFSVALAGGFVTPPNAGSDEKLKLEFEQAQECRAYTQLLPSIGVENGHKIFQYWISESDRIGGKLGLQKDAIYFQHLVIQIKAEKAEPVLSKCLELTPKKISASKR